MARSALLAALAAPLARLGHAGCDVGGWQQAYSPERCSLEGDAAIVQCAGRSNDQCGTRFESLGRVGAGSHSVSIKAAPGPGVVTTFYLSNNGGLYDKTCSNPWVELDFEIMGNQAGGESKIWTNLLRGTCQEHWEFITVPFDVTADYHTYGFAITDGSIAWVVDGVTYRSLDTSPYEDVTAAARSAGLQEFASLWGQSAAQSTEGIPEFKNALGVLDANPGPFPLTAGFQLGVTGGSPAPAPAPAPGAPCAGGAAAWAPCLARHCCAGGLTCFQKDDGYAQCRPSCAPGVHDDDEPQYQTPWSCRVLTPSVRR